MSPRGGIVWLAGAALILTACHRYEPLSLHGAGSMRVEVEVYKGPLSVSPVSQVGQLIAVLADSVRAMGEWRTGAQLHAGRLQCGGGPPANWAPERIATNDCAALASAIASSEDAIGSACSIIAMPIFHKRLGFGTYLPLSTCGSGDFAPHWQHIVAQQTILETAYQRCDPGTARPLLEVLTCFEPEITLAVQDLASVMRAAGFHTVDANLRYVPRDRPARALLASFGFIASEYGNQIQARISVLSKQLAYDPAEQINRAHLPVSDYLRDASTTDAINVFDWLDANDDPHLGRPPGGLDPAERIRMVERLTTDYYWEKINEVHASGQGDTSMAFIKDDLGNWNLRSFSNDPSELLRSYRQVTDAALSTAARLARWAAAPGSGAAEGAIARLSAAQQAASLADQLASGRTAGDGGTGAQVAALHGRVVARLEARKTAFAAQARQLLAERDAHAATLSTMEGQVAAAQSLHDSARHNFLTCAADSTCTERVGGEASWLLARTSLTDAQRLRDQTAAARIDADRRLAALPQAAADAAREILRDHLDTLVSMQPSAAAAAPAAQ